MKVNILGEIKRVMAVQAASIKAASRHIGPSFRTAVEAMYRCRGKIIVTGIGKSGVVAQKIASTLASTGTPAIFLHPAEGLHGNLGIVDRKDLVLAVGKSGESEEILNLIPALKKLGARIVCLTANKNSTLAKHSSIVLHTPIKREVCPLNLAPTTSTTVTLVVGDALAIALMKLRGFDSESFALYHPGGLLGKKLLLRVSDVMRAGKNNPVVRIDASLKSLLLEITRKWTGAASIVNKKGTLVGLVTDFDLRWLVVNPQSQKEVTIRSIMNPRPTFVYADDMAMKALRIMESRKKPFTVLPVVDRKKKAVGMVHIHDLVTRGLVSIDDIRR